jgi:hypothetical protein
MSVRKTYYCFLFVFLLMAIFYSGEQTCAQQSLLDREVNLSQTTGEIDQFLKEIARKGKLSFTYTSQIQVHRMASVMQRKQLVRNHLSDIFRFDSIQILEQNNKILLIPVRKKSEVNNNLRLVKGIVIDGKTRKPLPFSNVFLLNKSIGTITNTGGRFELKLSSSDLSDTLGISYIGYNVVKIPLESLDTTTLIIRLFSEQVKLKEVVIKPLDPIYILTKTIEQIPSNYEHKPAVFTGFFRESTKQDKKNISISEAVINIYKEPYISQRDDQVKIFKGRNGSNTDHKDYVDFLVEGSLFNILMLDIVKNPPTFLDPDYYALYNYRLERIMNHYERPTYVISFDQRKDVKYPCYKGNVYIDVETLAIVGASFELNDRGMKYVSGIYIRKTPKRTKVKPVNAMYQVFYQPYYGKWNLSNIRSEINIRVRRDKSRKQDKFSSVFTSASEFVITDKDTVNVERFSQDEISRPKDILSEQIGETDREFWGDENIIIPEEPIEKTIIKLGRKHNIFSDQEIQTIKNEEKKDSEQELNKEDTQDEMIETDLNSE